MMLVSRMSRCAAPLARFSAAALVWTALAIAPQPADAATNIQRVVSPGGIEAWLVEERAIPIISIGMSFRGGSSLDPAGLEGRAELFAGMLEEGAGPYDAAAFADAADAIAAKLAEFWCSSAVLSASSCASAERPRSQHRRAACGARAEGFGGMVDGRSAGGWGVAAAAAAGRLLL